MRGSRLGGHLIRSPQGILRAIAVLGIPTLASAVTAWAEETPHAAEAGEAHAPSIMNVDPGLMIWTIVTFVLLLVILRFTAWKSLIGALDEREKRIRESIAAAERTRQQAENLLTRYQQQLDKAKTEAHEILEEARADAVRLRHEMAKEAREEAEEIKARARREIELATDEAKKQLWDEAARLSTRMAEKILQRSLDGDDQRRLIEATLAEFRQTYQTAGD